jgi:hypothetical protein
MNIIDLQQRLNKSRQGGPIFSPRRRLYYALLYEPEATIPSFLRRETFSLFHWGHVAYKRKWPQKIL